MKKFLAIVILGLFLSGNNFADIEKNLDKLEKLLESGKISKKQYSDAKEILYKMENQDEQSEEIGDQNKVLRVKTYKDSKEKYEKNEVIFGKYRIYTHRPGGIKIRDISNNKQLVVISDKFNDKYYNGGDKIFNLEIDLEELEIILKFKSIELLKWTGKYVAKHQANFFQVTTTTNEPFHYYITLREGNDVG